MSGISKNKKKTVNPGMHLDTNLSHFSGEEKEIIQKYFATEFYVSNSGKAVVLGKDSTYKYFLMKFTDVYVEQFNIEREIVVLFSDYPEFQPRTLDAFDYIYKLHQELRIEKICAFLLSKDQNIEEKIRNLLSNSTESQVIVPFSYHDIHNISDTYFFRNRIKKHFYSRDLFSFESALKKEIYFFGRTELVHNIVSRHNNCENSGLFGLRKTGKTSIIFAIQRLLKAKDEASVYIDCQNTGFYLKPWHMSLKYIIDEILSQNKIQINSESISEYTPDNCAVAFEKDMKKIKKKIKTSLLIIFDEVERITFEISNAENWKDGHDFIHFWRTLRSVFQKNDKLYTYLIVSTNPKSVETVSINGEDNPLFSQIPFDYIPPFTVVQTTEMVEKLATVMGLEFQDIIYSKLTEDFGGHPFLIRMVCSIINSLCPENRPQKVDKVIYQKAKERFNKEYGNYIEMVITVLKEFYPDEYEMLMFLAQDDVVSFNDFASHSIDYTNHLLGYNIIGKNNNYYYFKIEAIRDYLLEKTKYHKINMSNEEKLAEISERRNILEPRLRMMVRTILQSHYDVNDAKKIVLKIMGQHREDKYYNTSYKDLFNPQKSEIYFEDLRKIIEKEWNIFSKVIKLDKKNVDTYLLAINKYRNDAHAKEISEEEMSFFRVYMKKMEEVIDGYI